MRYLDPETHRQHSVPRNYDSRPPDIRSRRPPQSQQRPADSEGKWQKGTAGGRPSFEGLDRDMDKYRRARVSSQGAGSPEREGRLRSKSPARALQLHEDSRAEGSTRNRDGSEDRDRRTVSPPSLNIKGRARSASGSDMSIDEVD